MGIKGPGYLEFKKCIRIYGDIIVNESKHNGWEGELYLRSIIEFLFGETVLGIQAKIFIKKQMSGDCLIEEVEVDSNRYILKISFIGTSAPKILKCVG